MALKFSESLPFHSELILSFLDGGKSQVNSDEHHHSQGVQSFQLLYFPSSLFLNRVLTLIPSKLYNTFYFHQKYFSLQSWCECLFGEYWHKFYWSGVTMFSRRLQKCFPGKCNEDLHYLNFARYYSKLSRLIHDVKKGGTTSLREQEGLTNIIPHWDSSKFRRYFLTVHNKKETDIGIERDHHLGLENSPTPQI